MNGVREMLKKIHFDDTDTRVKKYLIPSKILLTKGGWHGEERLLHYKNRQISTHEPEVTTMISTEEEKAGILLDFGTELHGGVSISLFRIRTGEEAKFRICFGESAGEALSHIGEKNATNDHGMRDFEFTSKSWTVSEYGATGFRFVYLELLTPGKVHLKTVQAAMVYQPYEYIGSFESDDERLNLIYDTAAYTCHLCLQNELWDGIKRDRLVWIGDLAPELKTVKYVWGDVPQIYNGLAFSSHNTVLPTWINGIATYSLWWLINLEEWVYYTGKREYLQEQKEYTVRLIRQILENVDENGDFTASDFIDWPSKGFPAAKAGARALLIFAMCACEKILSVLGEDALKAECEMVRKLAESQRKSCGDLKQIAALLLLADIANEDSVKCLQNGGAEGFSTFMSYYILKGMTQCCSEEEIMDTLKTYYGAMLDLGATTFWEDFDMKWTENACRLDEICKEGQTDIHGDHGKYCYQGFRHSLCHGWSSGPVAFLTEYVLGIQIIGEGCTKIAINPHLGSLKHVRGSIATPFGKLKVEHVKNNDGTIITKVDAPQGVEILK